MSNREIIITMIDLLVEPVVVNPKPAIKFASIPKYYDHIASYFETHRSSFLEAMYRSEISKPEALNSLKYRMQSPDFFNATITDFFGPEILKITEHEGKSYDWEFFGHTISVKSMHGEIFPRPFKRGNGEIKGQPIQLKNTKENIVLKENEFNYLLVTVANVEKDKYGLYLFGYDQVKQLLKNSPHYNKTCDENGYDGKGQIKLYVQDKTECLAVIEMDDETLKTLKAKYGNAVSINERNLKWITDQNNCIRSQIALSKGA